MVIDWDPEDDDNEILQIIYKTNCLLIKIYETRLIHISYTHDEVDKIKDDLDLYKFIAYTAKAELTIRGIKSA